MNAVRIVVADDSVLLREGLARLLTEAGHIVVGTADSAPDLLREVRRTRPDLAVVDVRMPPDLTDDGLRAARELRRELPDLAVLVLSQWVEASAARDLLADGRGGAGYLLKDRIVELDSLDDAIRRLAAGETVIDPQVVAQLMVRHSSSPLERLTPREAEVLNLMAQGKSNTAIAMALTVTGGAVEKHVASIFTKLDLPPSPSDHRRVLAVLTALGLRG
ncbi:MAG: response regulator transcription factor [Bifidobacteriaceae bacterium]|jgi:DNA-binding NarL/FixJ family response regulator|nr:response regulator transcription factor [Bifidobacteriaceae bacterium]